MRKGISNSKASTKQHYQGNGTSTVISTSKKPNYSCRVPMLQCTGHYMYSKGAIIHHYNQAKAAVPAAAIFSRANCCCWPALSAEMLSFITNIKNLARTPLNKTLQRSELLSRLEAISALQCPSHCSALIQGQAWSYGLTLGCGLLCRSCLDVEPDSISGDVCDETVML